MKKALITGVCGQDGSYLASLLIQKGYQVFGGKRRSSLDEGYRLRELGIEDKVLYVNMDLTDPYNVSSIIQDGQFDEIYNLAAQSYVGASWDLPLQTASVDAIGPLTILDAIKRFSGHSRYYQASTSEMYGLIQEPIQNESTPFYPRSPYGVSKLFAHAMTVNYRESHDLYCSSGILFNHESPLRGPEFVTKKIASKLVKYKRGEVQSISLGNLDARRDWGYAPEYVEGMWRMLQQTNPEDFVLATGITSSVRDFCGWCCDALGMALVWEGDGIDEKGYNKKNGKLIFEISEEFFRPAEVDVLLGDASKAKEELGWVAKVKGQKLAEIMVDFEVSRV